MITSLCVGILIGSFFPHLLPWWVLVLIIALVEMLSVINVVRRHKQGLVMRLVPKDTPHGRLI